MSLAAITRRRLLQAAAVAAPWALVRRARAEPQGLSFLAVGDWGREGGFSQRTVAEQMARVAQMQSARFIVSVGDNFYPNGVAGVDDPQWRRSFEEVYDAPALQVPWRAALGNHDHHGDVDAQIAYARTGPRWRMPARHYAISERAPDGATVDLFFLDTTPMAGGSREAGDPSLPTAASAEDGQIAWLDGALSRSGADWKLVIGHHPVFSGGQHGDTAELVRELAPVLERRGVHAYLNGHDHDLQHIEVAGVRYLTTGAGSKARPTAAKSGTVFCSDQPGFLAIQLDRRRMQLGFWNASGAMLHGAEIARAG